MRDIDTVDSYSENYFNHSWNRARERKPQANPQAAAFDTTDHGRIQAPTVVNVEAKAEKRDFVNAKTEAFMASGGAIIICKPGRYRRFRFGPRVQ